MLPITGHSQAILTMRQTVNDLFVRQGEEAALDYLKAQERSVFWAFYAAMYDDLQSNLSFCKELLDAHNEHAQGPEILDIGAGTGLNTVEFVRKGYRGVAVEPNPDMSKQLMEKLSSGSSFEIVDQTFEQTDLGGRLFDTVTSRNVLYLVENPQSFLAKAHKMTRLGGRILISNLLPGALATYPDLIQTAEEELKAKGLNHLVMPNRLMGPISRILLGQSDNPHFFKQDDLVRLLAEVGFTQIISASSAFFHNRALFVAAERPAS